MTYAAARSAAPLHHNGAIAPNRFPGFCVDTITRRDRVDFFPRKATTHEYHPNKFCGLVT
jgi:hypothetical protein